MKKSGNKLQVAFRILLVLFFFAISNCGKKEPPVAPRWQPPAPVTDLSHSIEGDQVKLTWTIPEKRNGRVSPLVGFKVFSSKVSISEPDCRSCPLTFMETGDVSAKQKRDHEKKREPIAFVQVLEPGYRYTYMVRCYSDNGMVSKDSNHIHFIFE